MNILFQNNCHCKRLCILFCMAFLLSHNKGYSATKVLYVGETDRLEAPNAASSNGYINNAVALASDNHLYIDTSDPLDVKVTVVSYFDYTATVTIRFVEKYSYNGHIGKVDHDVDFMIGAKYPEITMLDGKKTTSVSVSVGGTTQLKYKVTPSGLLAPPMHFGFSPLDTSFHIEAGSEEYDQYSGIGCLNVTGKSKGKNLILALPYGNQKLNIIWEVIVGESEKIELTASPSGGEISAGTKVYLSSSVSGSEIYFTLDGSKPSKNNGTTYSSSGIVVNSSCTLKAIAYKSGYEDSDVLTEYYTIRKEEPTKATCAEILAGEDDKTYRVTGTVKSIVNTTYGNWYLEDSTGEIYIYGTRDRNGNTGKNNSIEDWGIKEGYLVTVEGPRKTYKGTVELVDVVVVDCHEKSGDGTLERPLNAASANAIGLALGEGNTSEESYYIKGKVSRIKEEFTTTYGNCTFYISDDGTQNNEFYIYRALYLGNKKFTSNDQKLKEGDDVIIYGKITNYKGTPETKDKEAYLYSLNGLTGSGNGTLENPFNAFEALNEARKLSIGETSSNSFFVKGIISEIKTPYSEKYHRAVFYISDDGTANNQFLAYGTYYLENKQWIEGYSQIAVGDNVILYGKMCNYNGIYEMADKQNYIYSHNGNTKVQYIPNTMDVITSNTGNATFYDSHSAYSLPSGLYAQVITNASNSKLTYKTIADGSVWGVVPRGTAVMLVSDTKQAGTFTLKSSESTATYTGINLLRGSDEATTTTGDGYHYKLSYGSSGTNWKNVFGWYWGTQSGAPFQIEGHKAWLVVPRGNGTRAAGFSIDGEALGIDDLNLDDNLNDDCYDLQGRRISQPAKKGIYIRNGKKIVNN